MNSLRATKSIVRGYIRKYVFEWNEPLSFRFGSLDASSNAEGSFPPY